MPKVKVTVGQMFKFPVYGAELALMDGLKKKKKNLLTWVCASKT